MSSKKFAKLFDLEDGSQVVVTLEGEQEDGSFKVGQRTVVDEVSAEVNPGFASEESAQEMFDDYTIEKAKSFHAIVVNMLS
jgi:hypothetical protein